MVPQCGPLAGPRPTRTWSETRAGSVPWRRPGWCGLRALPHDDRDPGGVPQVRVTSPAARTRPKPRPDHPQAGHPVEVRILGHHGNVEGQRSGGDPRVVGPEGATCVPQSNAQHRPSPSDFRVDLDHHEIARVGQGPHSDRARRGIRRSENAGPELAHSDHRDGHLRRNRAEVDPAPGLAFDEHRGIQQCRTHGSGWGVSPARSLSTSVRPGSA